jgi:hypothetical protein
MEFGLAPLVISSSAFVPISEKEYEEIATAKAGLLEALFVEEKFDLVVDNYLELESCFLDSTARIMVLRNQDYQWFQVQRNLFNRRLVNLLSACRSYVDYSKQHIHSTLKDDKNAVALIESAFSNHYDNCLGYRVMEALRNFVQHHGFPIHAVEYPQRWLGEGDDSQLRFGLSIYTKTMYLREDGGFKKAVLEELESLGGRVNLKPLVRDYVAALGGVHESLREMIRVSIETWDHVFLGAIDRFKSAYPDEGSEVGLAAVLREAGVLKRPVGIFGHIIDYRLALQRKNSNLVNLGKRYVTGEVVKKDA